LINNSLTDDDDVKREIRNMFMRTNILLRRFVKCTRDVKVILFKTYCICLYDVAVWSRYNLGSINKLMACYNKCVKMFFGYKRRDSVTEMLFNLCLPSFSTILHNSSITFNRCWSNCYNELVIYFGAILKWAGLGCLVLAYAVRARVQWTLVCAVHAGIGQFKFVCYWVVFLYINVVDFNSFFLYYRSAVEVFSVCLFCVLLSLVPVFCFFSMDPCGLN